MTNDVYELNDGHGDDEDAEAAWDAEIDRRVAEVRSGIAIGHPINEVLAELRLHWPD